MGRAFPPALPVLTMPLPPSLAAHHRQDVTVRQQVGNSGKIPQFPLSDSRALAGMARSPMEMALNQPTSWDGGAGPNGGGPETTCGFGT